MKSGRALPAGSVNMPERILLLGASGLIGRELLRELCKRDAFLLVPARSVHELQSFVDTLHAQASVSVISYEKLWATKSEVDTCFCTLGTTQKVAGKAGLKSVDLDLVVRGCQWAVDNGAQLLSVVSAIGANPRSPFYYNRIKGSMELNLQTLNCSSLHLWRPSILRGSRPEAQPTRPLEQLSGVLLSSPLWRNYQALPARSVARAMLKAARLERHRESVFTAGDIRRLAHDD